MAWLPVNIVMILGHQDLTLGEGSDTLIWRNDRHYTHCSPNYRRGSPLPVADSAGAG